MSGAEGVLNRPGSESDPLVDKGDEGGMNNFCCCRTVGRVSIPALERHHQRAIEAAFVVAGVGTACALVAFIGAFATGDMLKAFPWVVAHNADLRAFVGVTYFCTEPLDGSDGRCREWANVDCSKLIRHSGACEIAREGRSLVMIPIIIGTLTYAKFLYNTYKRYHGQDSNCCKTMSCFSAFFGGLNFLNTLYHFWFANVVALDSFHDLNSRAGIGFWLMAVAMVLKIAAGLIHLALPVAKTSLRQDDVSEGSDGL